MLPKLTVFGCFVAPDDSWIRYISFGTARKCNIFTVEQYNCILFSTVCCDGRCHKMCKEKLNEVYRAVG